MVKETREWMTTIWRDKLSVAHAWLENSNPLKNYILLNVN